MPRLARGELVYEAARRFADSALRKDGSLFTPGRSIWALATIDDFHERFVENPDESSDPFETKLQRQLDDAPDETVQLAGEMLYVHFLIAMNISGKKKREVIGHVLSWSGGPASIPEDLDPALDAGFIRVGVAFNTYRPFQIYFLIEVLRRWKRLTSDEIKHLLKEPWSFKEFIDDVPLKAAYMQRDALLHLLHPDAFEPIISRQAKKRITQHFAELISEPTQDIDRQLFQIRRALAETHGSLFHFYDPEIRSRWQSDPSKWGEFIGWATRFYEREDFDQQERDYKLRIAERLGEARGALTGAAENWVDKLKAAFHNTDNNLTAWRAHDSFLKWCARDEEAATRALRACWEPGSTVARRLGGFLEALPNEVLPGLGSRVSFASFLHMAVDPTTYPFFRIKLFQKAFELTGYPPPWKDRKEVEVYEHALKFLDRLSEEASKRGLELRDRLDAQGVLWAVLSQKDVPEWLRVDDQRAYAEFVGLELPDHPVDEVREENGGADDDTTSPDTLNELAEKLLLDADYLGQIDRLIHSKRQVIFHGPPGTGKTYVARELGRYYAQNGGRLELVQFHPSYAYEDFIEGYRPTLLEGQPGFKPKDGPLKRIARDAAAKPGSTFVLLIDELNRGNLAKVFGELYFLLEYRDEEISLQYTEEPFSLPKNLWIIGTMNTADRSIALVDSALRRRFHFIPFFPDEQPIEGLLGRWLERNKKGLAWLAGVVDLANQRLGNRHTAIGPSYFLRKDLDEGWIRLIWAHSVLPYLQEQFFGEEGRLEEFDLDKLRAAIDTAPQDSSSEDA